MSVNKISSPLLLGVLAFSGSISTNGMAETVQWQFETDQVSSVFVPKSDIIIEDNTSAVTALDQTIRSNEGTPSLNPQLESDSKSLITTAQDQRWSVSPHIFVEGVGKEFYVGGVLTAHALVAAGVRASVRMSDRDQIQLTYGNDKRNIKDITVSSNVRGVSYMREFPIKGSYAFFLKAAYMMREVKAERTKADKDTGTPLTDKLQSDLKTKDALIGLSFTFAKYFKLKVATGLSKWSMKANVDDQFMLGSYRVTTYRVVDSNNKNSIREVGIEGGGNRWSLFLDVSQRDLGSKSDEDINGIMLGASYKF